MKIDHIECINLLFEYPNRAGFRYAGGICTGRLTSLVLVHTDTGEVGIGSAYSHPAMVYLVVQQQLEPMLRGEDPREVELLWDKMYKLTRWYGRKGAAMSALGALDIAFWDLRGKSKGKPIWSLLGGQRQTCPAYASALLWSEPDELAEEAQRHLAKGFRRMKLRMGRSEEEDILAVRTVRKAIGWDNDLMADASMRYHLKLAQRMGQFLTEQKVFWFEEPFQPEDIDAFVALHGTVGVRVAAGENEFGSQGFRELIRAKAVDIVQPDCSRCGGITEVWRVAQLAQKENLGVATHTWSDAVTVIANAHVVAAMPNGITVEVDQTGNPFIEELLAEPLRIEQGQLKLGDAPGLGIKLDQKMIARYRMKDPLHIPDGAYSDMAFGKQYFALVGAYQERK